MNKALIAGAGLASVALCLCFSCTKAPPPPPQAEALGEIPLRGPDLERPPALSRSIEAKDAPLPDSRDQHDLAIPFPSGEGIYPEDFYIGSLAESPEELGEAEQAARSWLRAFLFGGTVENYQSEAFSRPFADLRDSLGEIRFDSFRLAAGVSLDESAVSFLLRVRGPTHSASAELIVIKIEERWLVDDILLEDEPLERGQEKSFDPFTYTRFL